MEKIAVIGGGPAGYVAAITAAQQGKEVILIDHSNLGGTCLNKGCMPTKALLESAEVLEKVQHAGEFGISFSSVKPVIDWGTVQQRKNSIRDQLVAGIQYLMKKNRITVIQGKARFLTEKTLQVLEVDDSEKVIDFHSCIIATGSKPAELPFAPFDGDWVNDSGKAMELDSIPASLLIVGGGVIGCEFASIYSRFGTKVTIIEMADQLLPGEDEDMAAVLHDRLASDGVEIHTSASLKSLDTDSRTAIYEDAGRSIELKADKVLVSVGRTPLVSGLNLEAIGIIADRGGIHVNEFMQTNVPHIYAAGDVTGGILLAHVAFHEGTVAALNACGRHKRANYRAVPRCIYTSPEIASVGLTEKQAREQYAEVKTGEFSFGANGKAMILNEPSGKVKVLIEPQYNEVLGLSIAGPRATELIGQGTLMIHGELTVDVLEDFIAAHPTLSEAISEAIATIKGQAVHA
ncbi:dihydrolipoyl dehydrogenase [Fictibacillus fluitans]|uniref:Dihydrolipoyl dehydrogenase n=1 Tax=Fictibacillus fluitans TaxID=3058422 RepID=A0ABT8HQ85_9BACL|nr:dihydrolipoyl dehydrogenase [Fictibacillus sp. NE201]MDN4522936.1 dihydrolipoyl dehydrogenase [Fictibacillus sp. NE201]